MTDEKRISARLYPTDPEVLAAQPIGGKPVLPKK
jgi:hypothetical protein